MHVYSVKNFVSYLIMFQEISIKLPVIFYLRYLKQIFTPIYTCYKVGWSDIKKYLSGGLPKKEKKRKPIKTVVILRI